MNIIRKKYNLRDVQVNLQKIDENILPESNSKRRRSHSVEQLLNVRYDKSKADIALIQKDSLEFNTFVDIIKNTHGPTHRDYALEVLEIFKVSRDDDIPTFNRMENHRLLWHGSRWENISSILSKGLVLNPGNALRTGQMFGNGDYFADVVSKSANYCSARTSMNMGLILLCEVALGNIRLLQSAEQITDIPNDEFQSVNALGVHFPTSH